MRIYSDSLLEKQTYLWVLNCWLELNRHVKMSSLSLRLVLDFK